MPKVQEISGTLYVSIPSKIVTLMSIREGDVLLAGYDPVDGKLVYWKVPEPPSKGSVWRMMPIE